MLVHFKGSHYKYAPKIAAQFGEREIERVTKPPIKAPTINCTVCGYMISSLIDLDSSGGESRDVKPRTINTHKMRAGGRYLRGNKINPVIRRKSTFHVTGFILQLRRGSYLVARTMEI